MNTIPFFLLSTCFLLSCRHKESVLEREHKLAGIEKKTWILSKQDDVPLPRPYRGFSFYRKRHFYQYFTVVTNGSKHIFRGNTANKDISKCDCTWDITGDTIFVAYPRIGRVPFIHILKLNEEELLYQEFNSDNQINTSIITAIAVPDTVSNWTLNCPPSYRFEATHEPVKMLD